MKDFGQKHSISRQWRSITVELWLTDEKTGVLEICNGRKTKVKFDIRQLEEPFNQIFLLVDPQQTKRGAIRDLEGNELWEVSQLPYEAGHQKKQLILKCSYAQLYQRYVAVRLRDFESRIDPAKREFGQTA